MAKWVSLIVKLGALVFIIFLPTQFAIYLQLLGGILIIQTLPAVMLGVYTRWFNDWALLIGWAVGSAAGIWMFIAANLTPNYTLAIAGYTFPGYSALYTVVLNLVVAIVLTPLFNAISGTRRDETIAADYMPDPEDGRRCSCSLDLTMPAFGERTPQRRAMLGGGAPVRKSSRTGAKKSITSESSGK
jgi:Na+/proline symporter